jgi:hypothetical protein
LIAPKAAPKAKIQELGTGFDLRFFRKVLSQINKNHRHLAIDFPFCFSADSRQQ